MFYLHTWTTRQFAKLYTICWNMSEQYCYFINPVLTCKTMLTVMLQSCWTNSLWYFYAHVITYRVTTVQYCTIVHTLTSCSSFCFILRSSSSFFRWNSSCALTSLSCQSFSFISLQSQSHRIKLCYTCIILCAVSNKVNKGTAQEIDKNKQTNKGT